MTQKRDLSGMKFGRWTVIQDAGYCKNNKSVFKCVCDCGNESDVIGGNLTSGISKSCGCWKSEITRKLRTTHDRCKHPLYSRYRLMISRCENPDDAEYKNYGARGIAVCKEWRESFERYANDIGNPPTPKHSVDRIDNDRGYSLDNCRWATKKEQAINRRVSRFIEFDGKTMCLADWSRSLGMKKNSIRARLKKGWSIEKALTTPRIEKGQYERKPKTN